MMSDYNLEIERVVKEIKKLRKAKPQVLLQFPDGLKKHATEVVDEIESKVNCTCLIWMGTCYGACDVPNIPKNIKIDLLVQFGHLKWKK